MKGAEIGIYNKEGKEIFRGITGEDGVLSLKKPEPGTYTFKELKAPEGYYLNDTIFTFVIDKNGRVTGDQIITDVPVKEVIIDKTDVTDGKELPGAEITIYDKDQNIVFTGMTDEKGKIYFIPPAMGEYTFKETIAPEGYILNTTLFNFTIHNDGTISGTFGITNEPIKKIDLQTIDIPKTGDSAETAFSLFFLFISFSTALFLVIKNKKGSKKQEKA